jgi:ferredoxin-type protein NapF
MRLARRVVQILFFLMFLWLFLLNAYPFQRPYPVDFFLRLDPLIAIGSSLSSRAFIADLWPAALLLLLTILVGRFFCGWICPLGTALDLFSQAKKTQRERHFRQLKSAKYMVLVVLCVAALFSADLIGYVDPIALLTRSLATVIFPAFVFLLRSAMAFLFQIGSLQGILYSANDAVLSHILPVHQSFFRTGILVLAILLIILGLEFISRRFWCRNLCPLGALLALCSRFGLVNRTVQTGCTRCKVCYNTCKMDAIATEFNETEGSECILCFDCVEDCLPRVTNFTLTRENVLHGTDLSRRRLIQSMAAGTMAIGVVKSAYSGSEETGHLLRPPGSVPESQFLDRCIRCGACIRMCETNGRFLQPTGLHAGWEGIWTPMGEPRNGYCEYNCNLCGQVCPTNAIHKLPLSRKQRTRLGLARFDHSRCIPWYKNEDCLVCEEHCPTPQKAIIFRLEMGRTIDGELRMTKKPYVRENLCIGCGICVTKCPVKGKAGIFITNEKEERWSE